LRSLRIGYEDGQFVIMSVTGGSRVVSCRDMPGHCVLGNLVFAFVFQSEHPRSFVEVLKTSSVCSIERVHGAIG
jgi:hypothetical protein